MRPACKHRRRTTSRHCTSSIIAFMLALALPWAPGRAAAAADPAVEGDSPQVYFIGGTGNTAGREQPPETDPGQDQDDQPEPRDGSSPEPDDRSASAGAGAGQGVVDLQAAAFSGAAGASIRILVPPGRAEVAPCLALSYDSLGGNSWLGVGWSLDLGSVQRSVKRGVDYGAELYVIHINGSSAELAPRSEWGAGHFGVLVEEAFTKYYRNPATGGWEVTTREGLKYFYGTTASARQENPQGVFKWCLERVEDPNGNFMTISYRKDQGEIYPARIDYTGHRSSAPSNRVEFITEGRPDSAPSFHSGVRTVCGLRLKAVQTSAAGRTARRYELEYENGGATGRSRLRAVVQQGGDGATTLPPSRFEWQEGGTAWQAGARLDDFGFDSYPNTGYVMGWEHGLNIKYYNRFPMFIGDWNGDGRMDMGRATCDGARFYVSRADGTWQAIQSIVDGVMGECASWYGDETYPIVVGDWDGDGRTDVGRVFADGVRLYFSDGAGGWSRGADLADFGQADYASNKGLPIFTGDFNGDGFTDIGRVAMDGVRFHLADGRGGWVQGSSIAGDFGPDQGFGYLNEQPMVLGDFTGDGRTEVGRVTGDGIGFYRLGFNGQWRPYGGIKGLFGLDQGYTSAGEYPIVTGDFNGDGKTDVARVDRGSLRVLLSDGLGGWHEIGRIDDLGPAQGYSNSGQYPLVSGDWNGDGKTDLGRVAGQAVVFYLSDGAGKWRKAENLREFSPGQGYSSTQAYPIFTGDWNGDGKTGLGRVGRTGVGFFSVAGPFPDLMIKASGNLGGSTAITYKPSTGYSNIRLPFNLYTAASIILEDGMGNQSTTSFHYGGGYYDASEREFRGFSYSIRTNPDGATLETRFHQEPILKGRPYRTLLRESPGGPLLVEERLEWQQVPVNQAQTAFFVGLSTRSTWSHDYEEGQTHTVWTEEGHRYHEQIGSPVLSWSKGSGGPTLIRSMAYENTGAWRWRTVEETLEDEKNAILRRTIYGYDGANGNRLFREEWLKGGISPRTTFGYDECGNLISSTDPLGNRTTYQYDAAARTYPVKVVHPRTAAGELMEEKAYDPRFGNLLWTKDPNGRRTTYSYDTLGRPTGVSYPDGGEVTTHYGYESFPRYTMTVVQLDREGDRSIDYSYYDGLGRTIQNIAFGQDAEIIGDWTAYDAMGRPFYTAGPFYMTNHQPPEKYPYTYTVYDVRGRPLYVATPDGEHGQVASCFIHRGLSTTFIGPDGDARTQRRDYLGRVVEVLEHAEQGDLCTGYNYNPAGDLLKVMDHDGAETTMAYDSLGRKTAMQDHTMGNWSYTYDANGNLASQTDARGITITNAYDALGRLIKKSFSSGEPDVLLSYDDPAVQDGRGRLARIQQGSTCTIHQAYDPMGRVLAVFKDLDGAAGTTRYGYDLAGRLRSFTYPDNYRVDYAYHPGTALLHTVTGSDGSEFARFTDYSADGKATRLIHGNGTATAWRYDPLSGRLEEMTTEAVSGKPSEDIQSRTYFYTKGGSIRQITDALAAVTYTYSYDRLGRLLSETGGIPQLQFTYGPTGNIMRKRLGVRITTYTYDRTRKHLLTRINLLGGGTFDLAYDPNGNLTQGPDLSDPQNPGRREITWNALNLPSRIALSTQGGESFHTEYAYDGLGRRIKKIVQGGSTTYYLDERFEMSGGMGTRYIMAGPLRLAMMRASSTHYFHQDHLGGTTALTDHKGQVIEKTDYMPFGLERRQTGTPTADYRYTGREHDAETGLYNYNARLYDPAVGRFISADGLVQAPHDPQALNRYAYCRNNPLMYVDPSGHFFQIAIGALIGAALAGIQSGWDLGAMTAGAFIGGISGGVFGEVNGAVSSALTEVVQQSALRGAMAGAAGGAVSGAVGGALSAQIYGGNPFEAILKGAAFGAAGGAAFGAINGHYGSNWTMGRVGLHTLAGGGVAELSGEGFKNGAVFALATALSAWSFDKVVGEPPDPEPGEILEVKEPGKTYNQTYQNCGKEVRGLDTKVRFYHEHHPFMRAAGKLPLFNAFSTFHDRLPIALNISENIWYGGLAYGPSHIFALGVTYGAYFANNSNQLWQMQYY